MERENGAERIFEEIMAKSYPNLMKNINLSPRSSINYKDINSRSSTPRCIRILLSKAKNKEY